LPPSCLHLQSGCSNEIKNQAPLLSLCFHFALDLFFPIWRHNNTDLPPYYTALIIVIPTAIYEERKGLVEYNVMFLRESIQEICDVEDEVRGGG
jgi:hypothetical protein